MPPYFLTTLGLELQGMCSNNLYFRVFILLCECVSNIIFLCIRDPDLVRRIGEATALEVRATGIPYTFAPCIAVSTRAL